MNERIQKIIDLKKISPSKLADLIGVQRSGISHYLSGRNKPNLEFIQKLISYFPDINAEWLICGVGDPLKNTNSEIIEMDEKISRLEFNNSSYGSSKNKDCEKNIVEKDGIPGFVADNKKIVSKIIVFYSDNSFTEFKPCI